MLGPRGIYCKLPLKSWKPGYGQIVLGFPVHYSYGSRLWGFQRLGFYCSTTGAEGTLPAFSEYVRVWGLRFRVYGSGFRV